MIRAFTILTCVLALGAAWSISPVLGQGGGSPSATVTVHMHNLAFDPASTKVLVGQTVVFQNDDSVTHNVTASDLGSSGDIGPGKSWKYTFNKAGDYHYVCSYHSGMAGEIIVTAAQ